jgi:hypothetical protein
LFFFSRKHTLTHTHTHVGGGAPPRPPRPPPHPPAHLLHPICIAIHRDIRYDEDGIPTDTQPLHLVSDPRLRDAVGSSGYGRVTIGPRQHGDFYDEHGNLKPDAPGYVGPPKYVSSDCVSLMGCVVTHTVEEDESHGTDAANPW